MINVNMIIGVLLGGAVGSFITHQLIDRKYRDLLEQEVQDVRDFYKVKFSEEFSRETPADEIPKTFKENDIKPKKRNKEEYTDYSAYSRADNESPSEREDEGILAPFVIADNDYGEYIGYETQGLTYFSDGYLIYDDSEEQVLEPDEVLGDGNFNDFVNDDDRAIMYVRNPIIGIDYEISKVLSAYDEENEG